MLGQLFRWISFSRILNFKPIKIHRRDAFLSLSTIIKDFIKAHY